MPQLNLQKFEHIAHSNRDATVRLDTRTGQLRVDGNNFFSRAVRWVKDRWNARSGEVADRSAERYGAYNAFLRAIANDFYSKNDVSGIEDQFLADTFLEKDLSTRSIRQVLDHLQQGDSSARRNIIKVANFVSGQKDGGGELIGSYFPRTLAQKISERPVLVDAGYSMDENQKEALGKKILDAVVKKIDDGNPARFSVLHETMQMGHAVADGFIDEALNEAEAAIKQPEPAPAQTEAEQPPAFTQHPGQTEAEQPPAFTHHPEQAEAEQHAVPTQQAEPKRSEAKQQQGTFMHLFDQAEVRGSETDMTQLRNSVQNASSEEDAIHLINRQTVKYLEENRLQSLYDDVVSGTMKGQPLPQELQQLIKRELGSHRKVMSYSDAKAQVKTIIRNYVDAHDPGTLRKQLTEAKLPKAVHREIQDLIKNGRITSRKSLAERGNRCLADWVLGNRIGRWYVEEMSKQGKSIKPASDIVTIPQRLVLAITNTVVKHPKLWSYGLLKDISRRTVTRHVSEELAKVKV